MVKSRRLVACSLLLSTLPVLSYAGGALEIPQPSYPSYFYVGLNAGVFQSIFQLNYSDLTNAFPNNTNVNINQQGYTGGLALGYRWMYSPNYFLGYELQGSFDTNNTSYAAQTITEQVSGKYHFDLTLDPGMRLAGNTFGYLKIGASYGYFKDQVNAPTGVFPTYVNTSKSHWLWGFVLGIGATKAITRNLMLFAEYNYRDFGNYNLPNFTAYTTTYSHTNRVYTNTYTFGLSYRFL